jgi:hypothetical protein
MELRRFGIRHHGPGSARSVRRALDAFAPELILLEAPKEAEAVLSLVGDLGMCPPVALLGYVPDQPERAVFYPFAGFSPEWVAIHYSLQHEVSLRCFDLPLTNVLAATDRERRSGRDPIGELAAAAGYDDAERWWEDAVEHRGAEVGFEVIAEAMAAVRGEPEAVGEELRREATMRQAIRTARSEGFQRVAVVCGAWHTPALELEYLDRSGCERDDKAALKGLAKTKVAVTWVPWTNRRLTSASGYGAGITSPGWYAHVFDHPGAPGIVRWFARVAELLRAEDHAVSPDHLVAATRLADGLATLRGRPAPGLAEVTDAAMAVLGEGGKGPLALIEERLVVGTELGSVPAGTPMVPLARALLAEQKKVRLKPEGVAKTLELDVRTPAGLARSRLLHRLWAVGVPWGAPEESRRSTGTFRETWRLHWEPELSVRLVDASAYGTTVPTAAETKLLERAERETVLAELTGIVELALLADLPGVVEPVMHQLATRAAGDSDVTHLLDALGPLTRAVRYGDVRSTDTDSVREVIDGLAVRVCAGLVPAFASLDDDAAAAAAERLTAAQAAFALIDHPVRRDLWPRVLQQLAELSTAHGLVRGRATRLLLDSEWWTTEAAGTRLSRALSAGTPPTVGAAFVEGFLAGSGTALLHDTALLATIDRWLTALASGAFADVVPLLRRTFGAFEAGERRRIGELVAGRGDGRAPAPYGWDLDAARAAAAVATVRQLLGVGR